MRIPHCLRQRSRAVGQVHVIARQIRTEANDRMGGTTAVARVDVPIHRERAHFPMPRRKATVRSRTTPWSAADSTHQFELFLTIPHAACALADCPMALGREAQRG